MRLRSSNIVTMLIKTKEKSNVSHLFRKLLNKREKLDLEVGRRPKRGKIRKRFKRSELVLLFARIFFFFPIPGNQKLSPFIY
jgi:hypothetical protein